MRLGQGGAEAQLQSTSVWLMFTRRVAPGVESPAYRGTPAAVCPLASPGYYSSCGRGFRLRLRGRLPLVRKRPAVVSGLQHGGRTSDCGATCVDILYVELVRGSDVRVACKGTERNHGVYNLLAATVSRR